MIYAAATMLVGIGFFGYVLGNITSLFARLDAAREQHLEQLDRVESFMRANEVTAPLRSRVRKYYRYLWRSRKGWNVTAVLADLPPMLRVEIGLFLNAEIIEQVPLLKGAHRRLLEEIVLELQPRVVIPGEELFRAGEPGDAMYFIQRGAIEIVAAGSAEDCLQKVLTLCTEFIPRHYRWLHPINDVQVLAPMHKGVAGVANLNQELQNALNPADGNAALGDSKHRSVGSSLVSDEKNRPPAGFPQKKRATLRTMSGEFRPGDKLIQLRNNYDKGLFNGDIGSVVSVAPEEGTLVADFDGARHVFERGDFGDIAPAYCISIHKSQGSEYPAVIVVLLKAHFVMLQRNLLYTALTRGRRKVFLVGEPAAYMMAVRNSESKQRCTHLREKLSLTATSVQP